MRLKQRLEERRHQEYLRSAWRFGGVESIRLGGEKIGEPTRVLPASTTASLGKYRAGRDGQKQLPSGCRCARHHWGLQFVSIQAYLNCSRLSRLLPSPQKRLEITDVD